MSARPRTFHRRLTSTCSVTRRTPGLREYIGNNYDDAICWYARVDVAKARAVQDDLIFRLRPRFNTAESPPANHEDHT